MLDTKKIANLVVKQMLPRTMSVLDVSIYTFVGSMRMSIKPTEQWLETIEGITFACNALR